MKRILITGANSYIGTSFEKWVSQWPEKYRVDTINVREDTWKDKSFANYDIIYHLAAIVHVKENDIDMYMRINKDLAVEIAKKGKSEGVKHFVFLSTMGVYGKETGYINEKTKTNPKTPYAKSKLEAEHSVAELTDKSFKISILRPPIVYGKDCRGNYPRLVKLLLKTPVFPNIKNERSMIYIDNLSEFVRLTIDKELTGLLFPQNMEYVNTTNLAKEIAENHGKKMRFTKFFNPAISLGVNLSATFGKVFGTFVYDKKMPGGPMTLKYETIKFEEGIRKTEKKT